VGDIEIKDVSHVSIGVSDMERSIAFYHDVFGWEQLFDERMEGDAFEQLTGVAGAAGRACGGRIGSLRVELMHFNFIPSVPAPSGLGLRVLSMEVVDAHAAHAELVRRGVKVSGEPVEVFGVHMFFVIDPDGQGIEMCEYVRGGPAWGGAYR
jgi:glyoxylase I family protein